MFYEKRNMFFNDAMQNSILNLQFRNLFYTNLIDSKKVYYLQKSESYINR